MQAGTGRVDITPQIGSCLVGYLYPPRISRGVRNPLFATSVVLGTDANRVAFVSCDLIAVPRPWSDEAKSIILDGTGIPPERVMIAATHIHTGPCTSSIFMSEADLDYLSELPGAIAESVLIADNSRTPASLEVGVAQETRLSFNRRFSMRDRTIRTNPGIGNPDIIGPVGPIDPDILVISIRDAGGKLRGGLFNYANHVDVLTGDLIDPDYPGLLARLFRDRFGEDANLVYLNGACGDLNHIDIEGPERQSGAEQVEMMGRALFDDLVEALGDAKRDPVTGTDGIIGELFIPRHVVSDQELEIALRILEETDGIDSRVIFAREIMMLERDPSPEISTVMQAMRVGTTAFVGIPGEVFVEIGLAIKEASEFPRTAVVELANDYVGYLPTDQGYHEGGYEVTPARSSQAAPGAARAIVDGASELLSRLRVE
ncbi:MAG: hypothetical protein HXS50_01200 [Theionarchaea archaeon]|nr:hypothetical protein [Theionarchaea archaeon]